MYYSKETTEIFKKYNMLQEEVRWNHIQCPLKMREDRKGGFPAFISVLKNPPADGGDVGSIPGSGRSSQEGNGNPLWYSWLGNPVDRGAWRATAHGVTKSWTRLSIHTTKIKRGNKKNK